jgi:hypothetical protein
MNAHPDGFLGKASLRMANANALIDKHCPLYLIRLTDPMIGIT